MNFQIQSFYRGQSYDIFYSIPIASLFSSIDFTELRDTILSNLHGFDESRTPLTLTIESRDLSTRDQPGKGFAAP